MRLRLEAVAHSVDLDLIAGPREQLGDRHRLLRCLHPHHLPRVVPGVDDDVLLLLAGHVRPPGDVETSGNWLQHLNNGRGWPWQL